LIVVIAFWIHPKEARISRPICGKSIKEGDYLGMFGDDIVSLSTDKIQALEAMLKSLDEKTIKDKELLTLFCGEDVSKEEAQKALEMIESHFPDLEVTNYQGNQKVYSFLVGIE
jgi:dihydroxyacetone kinase-like predicted kinase